jgi:hypothetical protein
MCGFIMFQFLMGTYILEMNRWCFGWHIPFNCEEVVNFALTHNYWLWTCFVHPFVHLLLFFIHLILSFVLVFHPFSFFILGHMAKYSSTLCNILCHVLVKYSKKFNLAHTFMFMLTHSPNNNPYLRVMGPKWLSSD